MLKDAVPLKEIARALVIMLRHHGDVLLASPVLGVLQSHAPKMERGEPRLLREQLGQRARGAARDVLRADHGDAGGQLCGGLRESRAGDHDRVVRLIRGVGSGNKQSNG